MKVSEIRDRLRRRKEDYQMPIYLPFLPAILSILTIASLAGIVILGIIFYAGPSMPFPFPEAGPVAGIPWGVPVLIVFLVIIGIASAVIWIYVLYKWLDRRNSHFDRVILLYKDILDFLEEKDATEESRRVKRSLREMESESSEKPTVLWIILCIVFQPVLLYVFHFLTRDFYNHEKRENFLLEDISDAVKAAGGEFEFGGYDTIEDRNTILYVVLTIITFGIFGLYWIYAITKDPNKHFRQSEIVEENLLKSLEEIQ